MENRTSFFSILAAVACLLLSTFLSESRVYTQTRNSVVKGSILITYPYANRGKTKAGVHIFNLSKGDIQVNQLTFETTRTLLCRARAVDITENVKAAVRAAVQSLGVSVRMDPAELQKVETLSRGVAHQVELNLTFTGSAKNPMLSFNFAGTAKDIRSDSSLRQNAPSAQGGATEWEGAVTELRSNVPELTPLSTGAIKVTASARISQIDLAGMARAQVDFTLRCAE